MHGLAQPDYRNFMGNSPGTDRCVPDQRNQTHPTKSQSSFRISVASTASMASATSTFMTSNVRRFWAPSPPPSPPGHSSRAPSSTRASAFASSISSSLYTSPTLFDGTSSTASTTATTATTATTTTSANSSPHACTSSNVVTYIPPLVDPAHGTSSQRQRRSHSSASFFLKLKHLAVDLHWIATATPELLHLACKRTTAPLRTGLSVSRNPLAMSVDDIADAAEAMLQIWLAVIELGTLAAAPVLFLCLPGLFFSAWLGGCLLCIWLSSWPLNGGYDCSTGSVFHPPWSVDCIGTMDDEDSDSDGDDEYDTPKPSEHWFFVSGMGATSRSLSKTGPRVAGVFGHPVILIRSHTYGAVADYLSSAILDRFWNKQLSYADTLYNYIYPLLTASASPTLRPRPLRIGILAHNTGVTAVSQVLNRLAIDVPAEHFSQLEIFTFGSLASDFALPRYLGMTESRAAPPHIEHIAHVHDPCARFGVLRSVRDDLTARYCGGVFVLGAAGSTQQQATSCRRNYRMSFPFTNTSLYRPYLTRTTSNSSTDSIASTASAAWATPATKPLHTPSVGSLFVDSLFSTHKNSSTYPAMLSMEDYLTALFGPEPWSMRPSLVDIDSEFVDMEGHHDQKASSLSSDAPFLDAVIHVDRELAEKREMAAMEAAGAQDSPSNVRGKMAFSNKVSAKGAHFRLSWTGLGATAKFGIPSAGTSIKAAPKMASSTRVKHDWSTDNDICSNSRLEGLETARRLCREYDGQPGREVSVLAGYYAEAVVRHREMFGY